MTKAKQISHKDAEIEWCWDMFDRILEIIKNADETDQHITQIKYYAVLGLKGRKDDREV